MAFIVITVYKIPQKSSHVKKAEDVALCLQLPVKNWSQNDNDKNKAVSGGGANTWHCH